MNSRYKYFVVVNYAAHSGYTVMVDMDDIWGNDNPDGWTYQDLTAPYGSILLEADTQDEADRALDEYLVCDAAKNGRYCFTHNQLGEK